MNCPIAQAVHQAIRTRPTRATGASPVEARPARPATTRRSGVVDARRQVGLSRGRRVSQERPLEGLDGCC